MKIAILHAATESADWRRSFFLGLIASVWEQQGHEIVDCFGPSPGICGDVLLVHTNLSVVPPDYLAMARRHPRHLNAGLGDIRKHAYSTLRIDRPDDAWTGEVIVKSNLNHGGRPEWLDHQRWWNHRPLPRWVRQAGKHWTRPRLPDFEGGWKHYPIYESVGRVPRRYFSSPHYIVERFMPERDGDRYVLRHGYCLGGKRIAFRFSMGDRILRHPKSYEAEVPFPPALVELCQRMSIDYAKIDYVEHDGRVFVLDVNKTIGDPTGLEIAAFLAEGLRD